MCALTGIVRTFDLQKEEYNSSIQLNTIHVQVCLCYDNDVGPSKAHTEWVR
jgi:hypothetical protein